MSENIQMLNFLEGNGFDQIVGSDFFLCYFFWDGKIAACVHNDNFRLNAVSTGELHVCGDFLHVRNYN